jgi:hypothetical protein
MERIRYAGLGPKGDPVQGIFNRIQHFVLLVKVSKQLKFIYRHQGSLGQVTAYAPFNGIRLTFQVVDLFSEFFKTITLVGDMTLHGLLKSPDTFFNFFGMLQQSLKR